MTQEQLKTIYGAKQAVQQLRMKHADKFKEAEQFRVTLARTENLISMHCTARLGPKGYVTRVRQAVDSDQYAINAMLLEIENDIDVLAKEFASKRDDPYVNEH